MNHPPPNPSGVNPLHSRPFQSHAAAAAAAKTLLCEAFLSLPLALWRAAPCAAAVGHVSKANGGEVLITCHYTANATDANAANPAISPHRMAATTVAKHLSGRKMGLSAPPSPVPAVFFVGDDDDDDKPQPP